QERKHLRPRDSCIIKYTGFLGYHTAPDYFPSPPDQPLTPDHPPSLVCPGARQCGEAMESAMLTGSRLPIGLFLVLLLGVSGCGSDDALKSPTAVRLKGLGNFYLEHAAGKGGGKGPTNEQEFKKHLRSLPDFGLSSNGLDPKDIDSIF